MSEFKIIMPKLGESIQEGTITKWFVKEGDTVEEDDILFEVATDKVDSEIPSPVEGKITKILYPENSLVPVGEILAIINTDTNAAVAEAGSVESATVKTTEVAVAPSPAKINVAEDSIDQATRFYSPLVKTIAREENIGIKELESIPGSGAGGRVQKKDILNYLESRGGNKSQPVIQAETVAPVRKTTTPAPVSIGSGDQIIEMDRVRKLIADHMVMSKQVSPHVTSVVEADVTELVIWRNNNKEAFEKKYGEKITYMPVFTEAVAAAISEFPLINSSVDGDRIIIKKDINIGIAVAKPDGNLIVPVIRNTEQKNLVGLTRFSKKSFKLY